MRRAGRPWRRLRAAILAAAKEAGTPCSICHQPIEWDKRYPHKHSPSVDHRVALHQGGHDHPTNLAPCHLTCNASKGARHTETSRQW
jgi:hypothetical protein